MDALLSSQNETKPEEDLFGDIRHEAPAVPLNSGRSWLIG